MQRRFCRVISGAEATLGGEKIFYEVARDRLDARLSSVDDLDNKVAAAFVFSSRLLTFLGALLAITSFGSEQVLLQVKCVVVSQRTVPIAAFVVSVILCATVIYFLQCEPAGSPSITTTS